MNPLSPFTYYRRHKRITLLLMSLIGLMTFGICVMVRLPDSFLEHMYYSESYVSRVSLVTAIDPILDPGIASQIRSHPDVAQVMLEKGLFTYLPPISGEHHLFGVAETDVQALLDACDLHLKEGRLPKAHTNELALSETVARAIKVSVGDEISHSLDENRTDDWVATIPTPLVVVGILEGESSAAESSPPLGILSYEYVSNHELFGPPWSPGLVVVANEGRQTSVDAFLESEISPYADVKTYRQLSEKFSRVSRNFHLMFGVVDILVVVAIALAIGMINQIAQSRRLAEFGLLYAIGLSKNRLICRITMETAIVALLAWISGLALSWGFFDLLKSNLYEPNGVNLSLANLTPIWFSFPAPLSTVVFVALNTMRTFARLDAVAIIERDKLGMEADNQQWASRLSSGKPLSTITFYQRHRRRGFAMIVTMGLMILGVAFPAFIFGSMIDAWGTLDEHMRQVSIVAPVRQRTVDPGITARIKGHADVDSVVPAVRLWIRVDVPPMAHPSIALYGVSEGDLQKLIDLYGVRVEEGRLPQPRTNEMVLSKALAQNRDLHVGDKIGRASNTRESDDIPTEMVVVGILSSLPDNNDLWTGFVSLEYLQGHESYTFHPVNLLVISKKEHKAELDAWLEESVVSEHATVQTYESRRAEQRLGLLGFLVIIGIIESIIAVVAAIAMATLSYIFFSQRHQEFGILHAMGHRRLWLILRTTKESIAVTIAAWMIGVILCGVGLAYLQIGFFAPKGMAFNILNPAPWLFTLPMPIAVIAVSTVLVARMLSKLDPVAVIETR